MGVLVGLPLGVGTIRGSAGPPWRDLLDQGVSWDPQGHGWEEHGVTAT